MANRFTKGKGLLASIRTSGAIAANTATKKATVTTLTDTNQTLTAAQVVTNGGLFVGTPTSTRAITIPTGTLTAGALAGYATGDTLRSMW